VRITQLSRAALSTTSTTATPSTRCSSTGLRTATRSTTTTIARPDRKKRICHAGISHSSGTVMPSVAVTGDSSASRPRKRASRESPLPTTDSAKRHSSGTAAWKAASGTTPHQGHGSGAWVKSTRAVCTDQSSSPRP